jgi:hypothetical protein
MDGNLRIARWKFPLIACVDMGAYEYGSKPFAMTQFGFTDWPHPGGRYFVFNSQPNDTYSLWVCLDFSTSGWSKVMDVSSGGETTSCTTTGLLPFGWKLRFYRVQME